MVVGTVVCRNSCCRVLCGGADESCIRECESTLSNANDEPVVGDSNVAPDPNETKEFVVQKGWLWSVAECTPVISAVGAETKCWYDAVPNASAMESDNERLDDLLRARPRSCTGSFPRDCIEETGDMTEGDELVGLC